MCKTLSYHLEVFRSLFPQKAYTKARGDLSEMLDFLNRFYDLDLQQHALHDFTKQMKDAQRVMPSSVEAVDLLIADLSADSEQLRKSFPKQFKVFCGGKVQKHFRTLL